MIAETGCHGIAIGRGALADPWIFRQLDAVGSHRRPRPGCAAPTRSGSSRSCACTSAGWSRGRATSNTAAFSSAKSRPVHARSAPAAPRAAEVGDAVEPCGVRGRDRPVRQRPDPDGAGASTTRSRRTSRCPPGRFRTGEPPIAILRARERPEYTAGRPPTSLHRLICLPDGQVHEQHWAEIPTVRDELNEATLQAASRVCDAMRCATHSAGAVTRGLDRARNTAERSARFTLGTTNFFLCTMFAAGFHPEEDQVYLKTTGQMWDRSGHGSRADAKVPRPRS